MASDSSLVFYSTRKLTKHPKIEEIYLSSGSIQVAIFHRLFPCNNVMHNVMEIAFSACNLNLNIYL